MNPPRVEDSHCATISQMTAETPRVVAVTRYLTFAVRGYATLEKQVPIYQASDLSPLTRRLYDDIGQCLANLMVPKNAQKAEPTDVACYITSRALKCVSPGTLRRDVCGLNYYFKHLGKGASHGRPRVGTHRSPARGTLVILTLRGISRKQGRPRPRMRAVLLEEVTSCRVPLRTPTAVLRSDVIASLSPITRLWFAWSETTFYAKRHRRLQKRMS